MANKFYVHNDIFRYEDEVFGDSEAELDEGKTCFCSVIFGFIVSTQMPFQDFYYNSVGLYIFLFLKRAISLLEKYILYKIYTYTYTHLLVIIMFLVSWGSSSIGIIVQL